MQLAMCLFCAVAGYIWVKYTGLNHYYLGLNVHVQAIYSNGLAQFCINFITFWILLSYLVPISLFVSLEIVKFWQVCSNFCFFHDMLPATGVVWCRRGPCLLWTYVNS